ncbi:hypothetical protein [Streptomyces sp. NPDC005799]|uniref:hypothetical protein n=1 Tax=Streptomyces sp. NPDC005799 TaxID=3154678 RepID=UPI0033DEE082
MSSTFHIACLSHDPAVSVTDLGYNSAGEAEAQIRSGVEGHPNCDLLIIRWSGAPVEVGCPGHDRAAGTRPPAHWCRISHSHTKWVHTTWLRVLVHARLGAGLPDKIANHFDVACWTEQRVWRLREEIGLDLTEQVDESSAAPVDVVHPGTSPQVDDAFGVDEQPLDALGTTSLLRSWRHEPDGTWSVPVGGGVLTLPADTSPARRDQLRFLLATYPTTGYTTDAQARADFTGKDGA